MNVHKNFAREFVDYGNLEFLTLGSPEEERGWAWVAGGCIACGTIQPDCEMTWHAEGAMATQADCEMTWHVYEDELLAQGFLDGSPRALFRPRRWFCAVTKTGMPRVVCPSCYRPIRFDCIEGVWDPRFMCPAHLQMILPFAETGLSQ